MIFSSGALWLFMIAGFPEHLFKIFSFHQTAIEFVDHIAFYYVLCGTYCQPMKSK